MTAITIRAFSGIAPFVSDSKLQDFMATKSVNARFDSGSLAPWKGLTTIQAVPNNTTSVYNNEGTWITSSFRRQYVGPLIPNDAHKRIFYTDGGYPKMRGINGGEYKLGFPRPGTPSAIVIAPGNSAVLALTRNQSYVVTLVDAWGLEGPSSVPTPSVIVGDGGRVALDLTPCSVTGPYNLGSGATFRIYRTNTMTSGEAIFQYVADVAYGTASFIDDVPPGSLQEELISADWIAAPDNDPVLYPGGPLASLVAYPGGILCGHSGNTIHASVPYVPTAWPYSYAVADKVVGLAVIQAGLLICTTGRPVLLVGSDPSAFTLVPIESFENCVSATGIVDLGEYAIYPSPRGLVLAQGNSADVVTLGLMSPSQWAGYMPASIRAYNYQGKYVAFYGPIAEGRGFIFEFDSSGAHTFTHFSVGETAGGWYDSERGSLYIVSGWVPPRTLCEFNTGGALTYTWGSKRFVLPDSTAFMAVRARASQYPITFTLTADGVTRGPYSIPNGRPMLLPGGYRTTDVVLEVSGVGVLDYISLASTMEELE